MWDNQRKEILKLFLDKDRNIKNFSKAIDLCYNLIQTNRESLVKIHPYTNRTLRTINSAREKDRPDYLKNLINLYKHYEDYICNILLLIQGFSIKKNKKEAWRILKKLTSEMEEREIEKFIDIMSDFIKNYMFYEYSGDSPRTSRNVEIRESDKNNLQDIQNIFIRYLNLQCTIGKLFYSIGEFPQYEKYIINYVERLEKTFALNQTHGPYIIANSYLLLGNLYVELDNLNKAIILYAQCLNLLPDPKENPHVSDLSISANYNLGIVYFVTDQYNNSKTKLEQALKIKKILREKS